MGLSAVEKIVQELKIVRQQLREKDREHAADVRQLCEQHQTTLAAAQDEKRNAAAKQMRIHTIAMDIALQEKEHTIIAKLEAEFAEESATKEIENAAALRAHALLKESEMAEILVAKEREHTEALDAMREQYQSTLTKMQNGYLTSIAEKEVQNEVVLEQSARQAAVIEGHMKAIEEEYIATTTTAMLPPSHPFAAHSFPQNFPQNLPASNAVMERGQGNQGMI
jgi:hypothetical protein